MITATDLFCGAGGSSSGMEAVPGVQVVRASNHWALAIATHNENMPHVDHDTWDISKADPSYYPSTDILWASPSCTFWSQARGEKQDFTEKATEPSLFDLDVMDDADDEPPLSDDAKERSRALMQDVPRFAEHHRYKAVIVENTPELLKWYLFPKWIARMRAIGYMHQVLTLNSAFATQLGAPAPQLRDRVYVVFWQDRYRAPDFDRWTRPQAWCPSCEEAVTALRAPKNPAKPHGAYNRQYVFRCPKVSCKHGMVHPYALPAAAAIDWSTPGTPIGSRRPALAAKTLARIEAGLRRYGPITLEAAGNTFERRPGVRSWPVTEPQRTLTTSTHRALAYDPMLIPMEGREGKQAMAVGRPLRAQTARNETALLVPAGGTWNEEARHVAEPMRARTTTESEGVVVVPLRNNNRPKRVTEPLDTFAANGNHHGLAMLVRNNGTRDNGRDGMMCTPAGEPMRTLTTGGHQSLVTAGRPALGWNPDLMYAYDTGAFRSVRGPMATQTTVEGDALLQADMVIDDCLFRMLMPDEIKLGMAFAPAFRLLGTKREQVRLCGNAVTPPISRDVVACVVEAITGDQLGAAA